MAWVNPITWVAGTLTSTDLNTLRDSLKAVGDPWTSYAPTLTATTSNPTLGTGGVITASASQAGKRVSFQVDVLFGTGVTAGSGTYELTMPVAGFTNTPLGPCMIRAAGGARTSGTAFLVTGTVLRVLVHTTGSLMSNSTIAWAAGDRFTINGAYQAA